MRMAILMAVVALAGCGGASHCPVAFTGQCEYWCAGGAHGVLPVEACDSQPSIEGAVASAERAACSGAEPTGFYCTMEEVVPAP